MTDMDPTATDIINTDIETVIDVSICDEIESQNRLTICKSCENFYVDTDLHTKCQGCGCNISMLISLKFKECPLEKW